MTRRRNPKENAMRKITALMLLGMAAASLSACHTVAGIGQDMKAGGAAIQRAADNASQ